MRNYLQKLKSSRLFWVAVVSVLVFSSLFLLYLITPSEEAALLSRFDRSYIQETKFEKINDNYIFTYFTIEYFDVFKNFAKSLERVGLLDNLVVIFASNSLKEEVMNDYSDIKNYIVINFEIPEGGSFQSLDYRKILRTKFFFLQAIPLLEEYERMKYISYFDVDIVFLRDIYKDYIFKTYKDLTSEDFNYKESEDPEFIILNDRNLCNGKTSPCAGGFFFRKSKRMERLIVEIQENLVRKLAWNPDDVKYHDQDSTRDVLRRGKYRVEYFPCLEFLNGANIQNTEYQEMIEKKTIDPFLIHFNWMIGLEIKINAMKRFNLWYLKEEKENETTTK